MTIPDFGDARASRLRLAFLLSWVAVAPWQAV